MKWEEIPWGINRIYAVETPDGRVECFIKKKEVQDFIEKDSKGNQELAKQYAFALFHREAVSTKKHITFFWKRVSGPTDIEEALGNALVHYGYMEEEDFEYQHRVGEYSLDFAFPKEKIDIETDGEYWHPEGNLKDKTRDANLKKMGWKIVRLAGSRIKHDLSGVMREIADTVNERRSINLDQQTI